MKADIYFGSTCKEVESYKEVISPYDGRVASKVAVCSEDDALKTLEIAKILNIDTAILQKRSPSCGVYQIYDGSHSNKLIKGEGVTTTLLRKHNIKVITEDEL